MYDKHAALPLSEQRAAGFPPTGWRPRPGQPGSHGCGGAPCPAVRSKCLWICARHTACPLSLSNDPSGDSCLRNPLHKQQSLPLRPVIPLVARISDQNASGAPPMTVREKTRLEKFRQLLSSHNTDLGEYRNPPAPPRPREPWASRPLGDWNSQRPGSYCSLFFLLLLFQHLLIWCPLK